MRNREAEKERQVHPYSRALALRLSAHIAVCCTLEHSRKLDIM